MGSVISVSPFRCRLWKLHDRIDDHITEESCRTEIQSFLQYGQLVPVLGRRIREEDGCDVELIYGARRLFVARHTNKPLLVELRDLSDQEAIVAMDIENRQRKDISPYERGMSYARWLRAGYFTSQEEIAYALKVSPSQVSRLLKLARLPAVVIDAFGGSVEICEGWGLDLIKLLDNPDTRNLVMRKARSIASSRPRPAAREVYRVLLESSSREPKPKRHARDIVQKGVDGTPLFRIRHQGKSILLLLPAERVSATCLDSIRDYVMELLLPVSTPSPPTEKRGFPVRARSENIVLSTSGE